MAGAGSIPSRGDVDDRFKWDLSPLFSGMRAWEKERRELLGLLPKVGSFKGRLHRSNKVIARCFRTMDEFERRLSRLYTWAHLKHDEDTRDPIHQACQEKASILMTKFESESSYVVPELVGLDEKRLKTILKDPVLEFARVPLHDIIRRKEHYLSKDEEKLLALAGEALSSPEKVFRMLNDADLTFPRIRDESGSEVELSHGRYSGFLMSKDRRVREEAFKALYSSYISHKNTFASSLEGDMKARTFMARVRKYGSSLEAALDGDEIAPKVYTSLIRAVRSSLPDMYRYVRLRKKALGIDEVHMYDIYAPLVREHDRRVTFDEAKEIVMKALAPLGNEVHEIIEQAYSEGWMDILENRGKRSGAYSSGCYDSPPYMLMNYDDKVKDVFTLSHEMGHSVHSHLSHRNQPHITAGYRIFVAEVASTVNEVLLLDHLKKAWTSKEDQAYLVNQHLDAFKGTVFRQTMFAEFERDVSRLVEGDEPLTPDLLSGMYLKLNSDYFGPEVVQDSEIAMEWARIPHFYYDFYVYKYATGYCAATAIAQAVLEGRKGALERYLGMLRSGGSRPPLELLKGAGVDLTTPKPVRSALKEFSKLVDDLSRLV